MEILEEHVMKEEVEDTPKEASIKPRTKSCYSCGEEGHISQNCMNGDLVEFLTGEVEYDPGNRSPDWNRKVQKEK